MLDLHITLEQARAAGLTIGWIAAGITLAYSVDKWFCHRATRRRAK